MERLEGGHNQSPPKGFRKLAASEVQGGQPSPESPESAETVDHEPILKADGSRYLSGDFWASLSVEVCHGHLVVPISNLTDIIYVRSTT